MDFSMFAGTGVPDIIGAQQKAMTLQALSRQNRMADEAEIDTPEARSGGRGGARVCDGAAGRVVG